MNVRLDDIVSVMNSFDKDFDDPYLALQKIADILGMDKTIYEGDEE